MRDDFELFQVSCKVVLLNQTKDKVLLLKYDDGFLGIPGGHLEADESFEGAARRELKEELGIDYDGELELKTADKYRPKSTKTDKVDLYYAGVINENTQISIDDNKDHIVACEWIAVEEILNSNYEDWLVDLIRKVVKC